MVDILFLVLFISATVWGFRSRNPHHTPYVISLLLGIMLGLVFHKSIAKYTNDHTGLDYPFGSVASFVILIIVGSIIFYALILLFYHYRPDRAIKLYSGFSKANFISLPIIVGFVFCLAGLLFTEFPIRSSFLRSTQAITANSEVIKLSQIVTQGAGIDLGILKNVSLSQQEHTENIIPLNFQSQTITYDQSLEIKMTKMINAERAKNGVKPLEYTNNLADVARNHSIDMLKRRYFAHTNLEGKSPFDRLHDAKISYSLAGENLAIASSLDNAVAALMKSPTHRANILDSNFYKTGVGIAMNQDGIMAISEEFTN